MAIPHRMIESVLDRLNRAGAAAGRRGRRAAAVGSLPAIESLETRQLLAASPVAGAWTGGVFDSIGVFEGGIWQLDLDGDGFVGDDSPAFAFGLAGDKPIAGDWDGDGVHSVGVFRNGKFFLDVDDNRQFDADVDAIFRFGRGSDIPVAGNWDGTGGDEIGVFRGGVWSLDFSANGSWGAGDVFFNFGRGGDTPVTGNWNTATPADSVAVFRNGIWSVDRNENFEWDGTGAGNDQAFNFGTAADRAFAGDFVNDNTDEVAVFQDPPVGDPTFFVRELSSFPSVAATFAVTSASDAEQQAIAAIATDDDDLRDDLFAEDDELL